MKSASALALVAALLAVAGTASAEDPVHLAIIAEISGAGAPSGNNWRDGAELAIEEINAAGGILGRQVDSTVYDTQTDPQTSRAMMQKAIDEGAYVVLGTVYSGSTIVNMLVAQQEGVPQFVGSEAPRITEMGNPFIFRTSIGAQKGVPSLTPFFRDTLGARKVAVALVNNEFGKGGHDVFIEEMEQAGIEVVADVPSEQGATDYGADVAKLKASGADAVFVYMNQEENARFLVEARKQSLPMPLVGDVTLNDQKVIELAGDAANGAIARAGLTVEAPEIAPMAERFQAKYGHLPIQDAIKGYIAAWTTKYVTELVGDFDQEKFTEKMHGLCLNAAEYPNVFIDTCWDETGEMSRAGFMIEVKDGKGVVTGTVPAN
jgi:branched-chain amino acid transport system substrate-binding protein